MTDKTIKADINIKDAKIDIKSNEALCNEKDCKKTFRELLDKKTCENKCKTCENKCKSKCENKCETCEEENNDGEKCLLTLYLNLVIPDWRIMEYDRLYKHAQKVLENAEGIRRFEIELIWKRSAYMASLAFTFFAAFGGIIIADENDIIPIVTNAFLLISIALINTFLSLCFTIMNYENRKWQQNWEMHANYLHEILGSRLMRVYFHKRRDGVIKYFTIGKINVAVGVFITFIWFATSIILFFSCNDLPEFSKILFPILCFLIIVMIGIYLLHNHSKIIDPNLKLDSIDFAKEAKKMPARQATQTPQD